MEGDTLERLRRELRLTRIINGVVSVLLVCVLVGGAVVFTAFQKYAEQAQPLVEKLESVDWVALSEDLSSVDWDKLSEQLSELDMDALNEAIAGLDTEALSETLANLNEAAEVTKNFSDSLKSFFSNWE